jgi:hypothetical protein
VARAGFHRFCLKPALEGRGNFLGLPPPAQSLIKELFFVHLSRANNQWALWLFVFLVNSKSPSECFSSSVDLEKK